MSKKPITLNHIEAKLLAAIAGAKKASLDDLASELLGIARRRIAEDGWTHEAKPDEERERTRWLANSIARNHLRKPINAGLVKRLGGGEYRITAAGKRYAESL